MHIKAFFPKTSEAMKTQEYNGVLQKYLIFCLAKYLKIPRRYCFLELVSKIKIKILTPLYLLYLSLLYLRYSPTLGFSEQSSMIHLIIGDSHTIVLPLHTD